MIITFKQIQHIWNNVYRPDHGGINSTYTSQKKQVNGINWFFIWNRPIDGTETIKFVMRDEKQYRITINVVDNNLQAAQYENNISEDSTNDEINFLTTLQKQCWEDEENKFSNINIHKIGTDKLWVYKRKYFESWQQLIEYVSNSKLTHLVLDQLIEQANTPDDKKTIILPENDTYLVLKIIVYTPGGL